MKHGCCPANNKMRHIKGQSKTTGGVMRASTAPKSLSGQSMIHGHGTVGTNTSAGVQFSTRGMKEAMSPKGPGG